MSRIIEEVAALEVEVAALEKKRDLLARRQTLKVELTLPEGFRDKLKLIALGVLRHTPFTIEDLRREGRLPEIVALRRKYFQRARKEGVSLATTGLFLCRSHSEVLYHLGYRRKKKGTS